MNWAAPYLIISLAALALVQAWFVVSMVVIGRLHRTYSRPRFGLGPMLRVSELSAEELGLLAGGPQRWSEVALLRLCLEGHTKEDGLIILVNDPAPGTPRAPRRQRPKRTRIPLGQEAKLKFYLAEHPPTRSAREAILDRLRGRGRAHLQDVVYAGRRHGESTVPYQRLASLALIDGGALEVDQVRKRVFNAYLVLVTTTLIGALVCMAVAATSARWAVVYGMGVGLMSIVAVPALTSRLSGARFEIITGEGRTLLERAAQERPEGSDARLLHRVALEGLATIPEFAKAWDRGNPDAGMSSGQQGFHAGLGLFSAVFGLFPGSGGGDNAGGADGTKR
jgi:hypothetical protein